MAELRARHPTSPPENNHGNVPNYPANMAHNYNQPVQNFHIQGVHYPQNHNMNVSSNYGPQQAFPNFGPVRNPGPFGNPVSITIPGNNKILKIIGEIVKLKKK